MGHKTNFPSFILPDNYIPDGKNVIFKDGMITNSPNPVTILEAEISGNVLDMVWFNNILVAFTSDGIYKFSSDSWVSVFAAGGTVGYWSYVEFNGILYATNNIDYPLKWTGTGSFVPVEAGGIDVGAEDLLTRAKIVTRFENMLLFMNCSFGTSHTHEPRTIVNSEINDATTWNAGNADITPLNDGDGEIYAAGQFQDFLFVFTNKTISRIWLGSGSALAFARVDANKGCMSPGSVVNGAMGELYFLDTNKDISVFQNAYTSQVVSADVTKYLEGCHQDNLNLVRAGYIPTDQQVWFSLPVGVTRDATTKQNTQTLIYDSGRWFLPTDLGIAGFGKYTDDIAYTIGNNPWLRIKDVPAGTTYASLKVQQGKLENVYIDYAGAVKSLDNVTGNMLSEVTLTTNMNSVQALAFDKRIQGLYVWFKTVSDITVILGSDKEDIVRPVLFETRKFGEYTRLEYSTDILGSVFDLTIKSAKPFQFAGVVFDFSLEAELG